MASKYSLYTCFAIITIMIFIRSTSTDARLLTTDKIINVATELENYTVLDIENSGKIQRRVLLATTKDNRPTSPGGSPGIGHIAQSKV